MATMTTPWLYGIGLILLFTTNCALSGQQSGILSKLYKKAAQENRPMILVIDNSLNSDAGKNRDLDYSSKGLLNFVPKKTQSLTGAKKQPALDSHLDRNVQNNWPNNDNKHLGPRHHPNKSQRNKAKVHNHENTKSLRSRIRDRKRLQSQLNRDDRNDRDREDDRDYWDNLEDRDRRDRYRDNRERRDRDREDRDRRDRFRDDWDRRDRDRLDQNRDDQDRRDRFDQDKVYKDRDDRDRRDRDRDYRDRRDRDRDYRDRRDRDRDDRERRDRDRYNQNRYDYDRYADSTLRLLAENSRDKHEPQMKVKNAQKDIMFQPSVIKNLLRITNDLNCEAQDECQDKCEAKYNGKKQDDCENKCEAKFECDPVEEKRNGCDDNNCSLESECGESGGCDEKIEDKNPSTRELDAKGGGFRGFGGDNLQREESLQSVQANLEKYMSRRESLGYEVYPGTEREEYDFSAERHSIHATNLIESTAHLIKGCLGAGVLSIHVGFMHAGIWTALIITVLIGITISHTMTMLVKSAHGMYLRLRMSKLSYPDLAEVAVATGPWKQVRRFSKIFRYLVDTCLIVKMCGSCCIYEIMIAETVKKLLESISPAVRDLDLNLRYYLLIVTGPLIMVCLIRDLKYLAPLSFVADVVIGFCVIVTMYFNLSGVGKISERPVWKSIHGFIRFCGICLYSLDGVSIIMPVENNMKKPQYFYVMLQYGMTTAIVVVACTGFFGYWEWGENCKSPITIHMPNYIVPLLLQLLVAIMLSVTFAIHFWVPFAFVWHYIGKKYKRKRVIWERVHRTVNVLLITGLSLTFPNLIRLMIFIGNFFLSLIILIFPAIIESLVTWHPHSKDSRWILLKNAVLILIGVFLCCGAFCSLIYTN